MEPGQLIPPGIWTLADVLQYGRDKTICPYFAVRRMVNTLGPPHGYCLFSQPQMPFVDVIIYSFHYLLDPKVAEQVSKEMSKDAIVVFDEAHNIGVYSGRLHSKFLTQIGVRQRLYWIPEYRFDQAYVGRRWSQCDQALRKNWRVRQFPCTRQPLFTVV